MNYRIGKLGEELHIEFVASTYPLTGAARSFTHHAPTTHERSQGL
jgi:hypothetical protein